MPYEAEVRSWLGRSRLAKEDVDDLIQETYCRLAALDSVEHIGRPDAYFFSIARNLLVRQLRRQRIVSIEAIAEIDAFHDDHMPSPERETGTRLDFARIRQLLADLPTRRRRVVEMRKFEGYSQREIAQMLGLSEHDVENDIRAGVKAVLRAWREAEAAADDRCRRFERGGAVV